MAKSLMGTGAAFSYKIFSIVFDMNRDDRRPLCFTNLHFDYYKAILILLPKACFVNIRDGNGENTGRLRTAVRCATIKKHIAYELEFMRRKA